MEILATSETTTAIGRDDKRTAQMPGDGSFGFSFAAAMIALEGRAAQSLETYGAAPDGKSFSAGANESAPQKMKTQNDAPETAPAKSQADRPASAAHARSSDGAAASSPMPRAPQAAPPPASATPPAALAVLLPAAPQTAASPMRTDARPDLSAVKTAEGQKAAAPKAPRAPLPAQPSPAAHEPAQHFAKLVAQRLHTGATAFELRLDPPALGRVDASLRVADDGETILALKFEHQAALDLFARDQAGLRAALSDAGFDLGGDNLAFSLADPNTEQSADAAIDARSFTAFDPSHEPLFRASYSTGAVDLRI